MPTVHVEPSSEDELQTIAHSLLKARKVVVITGAGISTNSGIPDFRSENGLYSLIQAQFDAAAKQAGADEENHEEDSDASSSLRFGDDRPTKRRKLSLENDDATGAILRESTTEEPTQLITAGRTDASSNEQEDLGGVEKTGRVEEDVSAPREENVPVPHFGHGVPSGFQCAEAERVKMLACQPSASLGGPEDSRASGLEPGHGPTDQPPGSQLPAIKAHEHSGNVEGSASPLPSPALSGNTPANKPTSVSLFQHERFRCSPLGLALKSSRVESEASSPLSSPPAILFDPYQECLRQSCSSSSGSSTPQTGSSRSQSEDPSSVSTPLLTSQSSSGSSSGRASLPNMKGRDLFDAQIWSDPVKTSVFYTFATTLRQKSRDVQPTDSHRFVSALRDSRKLVRCYTQNIDQLEERVGLSTSLELGAGSRYRFATRNGRPSGASRQSLKDASGPQGTESSQNESEQNESGQSQQPTQSETGEPAENSEEVPQVAQETTSQDVKPIVPTNENDNKDSDDVADGQDKAAVQSTPASGTSQAQTQSPNRGVECVCLHGSLSELRCFACRRTSSWDEDAREVDTMAGRQPTCPHCAGATAAREERGKRALGVGKLRPDIVLYGEEHPSSHLISPIIQHDLSLGPDMLIILGTSLRVHGLKVIVKEFAKAVHNKGGRVVFVNFTKPPESVWSDVIDYWIQWDCDAWVGDLQQRKPALWLPYGTQIESDEQPPPAKSSRRENNGEGLKRRETGDGVGPKRKKPAKSKKVETALASDSTLTSDPVAKADGNADKVDGEEDMPPPPRKKKRKSKDGQEEKPVPKSTDPIEKKERKLNPNAKRPASVRDHKNNGAYYMWTIMQGLAKITGEKPYSYTERAREDGRRIMAARGLLPVNQREETASSLLGTNDPHDPAADSSTTDRPETVVSTRAPKRKLETPGETPIRKTKKARKSAPAAMQTGDNRPNPDTEPTQDASITTLVKSRNRKRLAWKMVNGVETKVSVDGNGELSPEPTGSREPKSATQPSRDAPPKSKKPSQADRAKTDGLKKEERPKKSRTKLALERLRPADPITPGLPMSRSSPRGFIDTPQSANSGFSHRRGSSGFAVTDRLIAVARHQEELASRPSTPLQLPPLRMPAMHPMSLPKIQPLEPKVESPGPVTSLSSDVGSPIATTGQRTLANPFFFNDPLLGHLQHPTPWHSPAECEYMPSARLMDTPREVPREMPTNMPLDTPLAMPMYVPMSTPIAFPAERGVGSMVSQIWGPEEQLRKEQEAALTLTGLRTGH